MGRVKTDLLGWEVKDQSNSWTDQHVIIGGVGVVKVLNEDGELEFQVVGTEDGTLNIMERVGMAAAIDTYFAQQLESAMYPDEDD